jgi:tRNA modification GTPase
MGEANTSTLLEFSIMEYDTIAAIASPIGSSGIGIIRISGSSALSIGKELFLPHGFSDATICRDFFENLQSHHLYYGHVCNPNSRQIVDEVLMVVMRAPKSYTREDVVEIQSHSGSVILRKILNLVLGAGCRLAEPGEFTKRAFLNGRIDLSQAEAIAEMISAKSEAGLKLAVTHLTGQFKERMHLLLDILTHVQIEIEAGIEFPDDIEHECDFKKVAETIQHKVLEPIESLIQYYDDGHVMRDGIRLAIVGRPNVGKSSLLNLLLKKDKAIVTPVPGTTRDLIEDYITIDGIPILMTDTAGLHPSEDPVEVIGIHKTKENIQSSDLVLWVVDCTSGFTLDDQKVFQQIRQRNTLLVINKMDLISDADQLPIPDLFSSLDYVSISAKFGDGVIDLKKAIKRKCLNEVDIVPGRSLIPNLRQTESLKMAAKFLKDTLKGLSENSTEELIVSDLVSAKNFLGAITGDTIGKDILDEIFSKFCIGK